MSTKLNLASVVLLLFAAVLLVGVAADGIVLVHQGGDTLTVLALASSVFVSGCLFMIGTTRVVKAVTSKDKEEQEERFRSLSTRCPECELRWSQHSDEDMDRCMQRIGAKPSKVFECQSCAATVEFPKQLPCPRCQSLIEVFE